MTRDHRPLAVLGAGIMGHGIAHAALCAGYTTRLYDVSDAPLAAARGAIEAIVAKGVELGKVSAVDATAMMARLTVTSVVTEAVGGAGVIIEAAPERIDVKLALLAKVQRAAPAEAVIARNTSALRITEMAAVLDRPGRMGGMHFFNPVLKMKLVEVVRALETTDATVQAMTAVAVAMGKETVLQEGVASARDID